MDVDSYRVRYRVYFTLRRLNLYFWFGEYRGFLNFHFATYLMNGDLKYLMIKSHEIINQENA